MTSIVIHIGTLGSYAMTSREWNSERQVAELKFENDSGIEFETEAMGMSDSEVKQAMLDEVISRRAR